MTTNVRKALTREKITPISTRMGRSKQPPRRPDLPKYLTQQEVARFNRTVKVGGSLRDAVLFGLMYRFGLRASEVTMLELDHVDLQRKRIQVQRAKNGPTMEHRIPADLVAPLRKWIKARPERGGPWLFPSRQATNQQGMSVIRVRLLFKQYAKLAGLRRDVSSHALRHSIAVHALEAGENLEHVADLLGHRSVRSTTIYAQIVDSGRNAMMSRLDKSKYVVTWRS